MKEFEKDIALHHAEQYASANHCAADKASIIAAYQRGWLDGLANQWISVEEALPDDDENVFIMNEYGGCGYAHYDYNNKIWRMSSGCNADESDEIYSTITHWMEIPKNK